MFKKKAISNHLTKISLKHRNYTFEITTKKRLVKNIDKYYFAFQQRNDSEYLVLTPDKVRDHNKKLIHTFEISLNNHKIFTSGKGIWDLYLIKESNSEFIKSRVQCNLRHLRFLSIVFDKTNEIFYPFTTVHGNFSFQLNDFTLFAGIENITLQAEHVLINGYFNYPLLFHSNKHQIKNLQLVITNNIDKKEVKVPLKVIERPELLEESGIKSSFKDIGFTGTFKLNKNVGDAIKYHQFYLELVYGQGQGNTVVNTVRSVRLKWENGKLKKRLTPSPQGRIMVKLLPTKKAKYLSLQTYRFNFINELKKSVKSNLIKFRRSDLLLNVYKFLFYLSSKILPLRNSIMFESFHGKQYSDSPRAIYEYLKEQNSGYNMVWSVDRDHINTFESLNIKYVQRFSLKWLMLMTQSKYWITNSRLPLWLSKPTGTTYVQTWHGTPLKRLAADMEEIHMPGTNLEKYKHNFLREASKWDYLISPNAYSTEIFKRAFKFKKTVIESGYPRNDFIINNNNAEAINNIKRTLNLPENKKIILYAPTWRDNQFYSRGKYKFDLQLDLEKLYKQLGDNYILLLRLHYLVAEDLDLKDYRTFAFDFSAHPDIRELYLVSDILITDYSSVFFDYANLRRPMIFYVYDLEEYRDNLRGFYFNFEKQAPGPLVKTTDRLIKEIKTIEKQGFSPSSNTNEFYDKFCYLEDGHATKRVVENLFSDQV